MILRRIIAHFRKQEWTAIALDFVIVVVGVFVGLQAQAWNESRQDRVQERMYIERLARDFTAIEERTEFANEKWLSVINVSRRLLADIDAFNATGRMPRTEQAILVDLNDLHGTRIPAPRAATFVEMLSTGEIRVLRDEELRDALLAYDTQTHYALIAYDVLVNRTREATVAAGAYAEVDLPDTLENIYDNPNREFYRSIDFPAFARDPRSRAAVSLLGATAVNQGGLSTA
ncbi:hypothetical protein, partial [Terricaulis sp.]|uniref:hypothetical protein n=1 Tax=Terricaulis sp. TaxID=2768686 RepID=UPI002AC42ED9